VCGGGVVLEARKRGWLENNRGEAMGKGRRLNRVCVAGFGTEGEEEDVGLKKRHGNEMQLEA